MSRRIVTSLAVVLFTGALGSMLATCGRPADASTAAGPGLAASMLRRSPKFVTRAVGELLYRYAA